MSQVDSIQAHKDKQKLNQHSSVGDRAIHYGHAHAQTEALFKAHQMNAQLEQLAKEEGALPQQEDPEAVASVSKNAADTNGENASWSEVALEARRTLEIFETSAKNIGEAALRLAKLPMTFAKTLAGSINPLF